MPQERCGEQGVELDEQPVRPSRRRGQRGGGATIRWASAVRPSGAVDGQPVDAGREARRAVGAGLALLGLDAQPGALRQGGGAAGGLPLQHHHRRAAAGARSAPLAGRERARPRVVLASTSRAARAA